MIELISLILDLAVIFAIVQCYKNWKAKKKEAKELSAATEREAHIRSLQVDLCSKWFESDYAAFDKYLEDFHANRLFFPVHVETLYAQDFGGYNVQDIYNVLSVLIQDMEENDKILNECKVPGGPDRLNKIQRCKHVQAKYYGERKPVI